jgi:Na+/H+-dicarboxylate symporter
LLVAVITSIGLRAIGPAGQPVRVVLEAFSKALSAAFNFLMKFAPLGAFGTIAYFVAVNGIRSIGNLGMFIFSMYAAAVFFVFGLLWLLAALHGFSFIKLLRYMREEILVVLSTSSSEPVLPAVMAKLENLGCGKNSIGISLPLGYSFNLSGTAIYIALATLFLAQTMDVSLHANQILPMGAVMLLAAKTAAGFSGSGFIALTTALAASHSTTLLAGTSFIAGIDRFQSEARAVTSVITNITSCVIIAIWEKECDVLQLKQELNGNSASRA